MKGYKYELAHVLFVDSLFPHSSDVKN